jgi:hypothetical protein
MDPSPVVFSRFESVELPTVHGSKCLSNERHRSIGDHRVGVIENNFISDILPELEREKMRYERRKKGRTFFFHMDDSKSHDDGKSQGKFDIKGLVRAPDRPYSPDLSPCDCWFFGMAKGIMKDRTFHAVQDIRRGWAEIWNDRSFEDV